MIKYILIIALTFVNNVYASDIINITFLGTGTPRPDINKLGPSILLKYKEHEILFDAGRGITLRLDQINNNYSKIHDIYISHMHFDHIVGLADFWLTSNLWQKKKDTNVAITLLDYMKQIFLLFYVSFIFVKLVLPVGLLSLMVNLKK